MSSFRVCEANFLSYEENGVRENLVASAAHLAVLGRHLEILTVVFSVPVLSMSQVDLCSLHPSGIGCVGMRLTVGALEVVGQRRKHNCDQ